MRGSRSLSTLALGLALAGTVSACGGSAEPSDDKTTNTAPTSTTSGGTTPKASAPAAPKALGPLSYGALKLGMTKAEAVATGEAALITGTKGDCGGATDGFLAGAPAAHPEALPGKLVFSTTSGKLVAIYAIPGAKTPEGVGLGSSYAEVHTAYPSWKPIGGSGTNGSATNGRGSVPAGGGAHYRIVVSAGAVKELSLDSDSQDCYE
jgi:hypothetical protein